MKRVLFSFFTLLFSLILIGVFVFVPRAQAACTKNPTWQILGHSDGPRYVTYHLRLINNCAGSNAFRIRVSDLPNAPQTLHADWRVRMNNGDWGDLNTMVTRTVSGSENIDVRVIRDVNYYHPDQVYRYVSIRAALDSNTAINSTVSSLVYIVVNRPDLIVSAFNYPGGPTCQSVNPNVRIKNIGWVTATANFNVRVENGHNGSRVHTVTQAVSHNGVIDLSNRFSGMGRPPVGSYQATAAVDVNDNVFEEVENNNVANDNYNTTACNPIGWHDSSDCSVTRGWTCDADNYSQSLSVHFYEGSTFLGSTVANQSRPDVPAAGFCGGNANVGFSFTTPESLKDGRPHTITAYSINIGSGTGNPALSGTPKTIVCTPPVTNPPPITPIVVPGGYTISGGVYEDVDESGSKQTTEDYIGGTIVIRSSTGATINTTSVPGSGFRSNPLPAGRYTISYTDPVPPGSSITYPTVLPASITMNLGPTCVDDIPGDPTCSASNITDVNFGLFTPLYSATPWIHGVGGDMRVDREMDNIIPDGFHFSEELNSTYSLTPGVVFGGSGLTIGSPKDEKASINEWLVNSPYTFPKVNSSYNSMYDILNKGGALSTAAPLLTQACTISNPPNCTLDLGLSGGIYTADRFKNVILNPSIPGSPYVFQNEQNYIFLIYEDLVINTDISVPKGSTVMFIVKGNITVNENVERIDGIYSTENDFTVKGCDCEGADQQLTINGSVIANAGLNQYRGETPGEFINERNLGDRNDLESAVEFNFRPDFILNMPEFIRYKNYTIREVAPGSKSQP